MDKGDLLDLDWLEENIKTVPSGQIDILGGEPSLLPDDYMKQLLKICKKHAGDAKVGMYTNLIKISSFVNNVDDLTVSYDPGSRQLSKKVLQNMLCLDVPFKINMIATKYVVELGAKWLIELSNHLRMAKKISLSTLTVFPGCPDLRPDHADLTNFCRDIIEADDTDKIYFYPITTWTKDYIKQMNPSQTIEILPNRKFRIALRDFFGAKEFDTYEEACEYYEQNYNKGEPACDGCPYFRRCTHMYTDGKTCHEDRMITEAILSYWKGAERKFANEHLPELPMQF